MVKELKNYQSQVNAYKFEIERLDKQILSVKDLYFNSRQQAINEEMEETEQDQRLPAGDSMHIGPGQAAPQPGMDELVPQPM